MNAPSPLDQIPPTQPPIDPGCLPAWEVDDIPPPPTMKKGQLLKMLGPGLVLAGGAIGSGEWVMGPQAGARYHGALMWVVLVSIVAQAIFNTEVMRYTLATGEPIMTGFLRTKPGPKFWIPFYLFLDSGSWWPALSGLSAQVLVVVVQGLSPQDAVDQNLVRTVSCFVLVGCASAALFGGKIYNTLSVVMTSKVTLTLTYLLFCCIFLVSFSVWGEIWGGLVNPFKLPRDAAGNAVIDWGLIAALVGYSGAGGLGNVLASNFVREKGWGMGAKVGAIPSAFGGHKIALSHIGTMARPDPVGLARFRGWMKQIKIDQYAIWAGASLAAMMLTTMLGREYLRAEKLTSGEQWKWAVALAQDFGAARGKIFYVMTIAVGLIIFLPGQFFAVDVSARRWTDAVWSGNKWARTLDTHKVKYLYYTFAGLYVGFGLCAILVFPNLSASGMLVISGNAANLSLTVTILHTLYVNNRFLPKGMRPSRGKNVALLLGAAFFFTMFCLVVQQKLLPFFFGK